MTYEQWINSISKEELAFRMYGKEIFKRTCLECVFYKPDKFGHPKCTADDVVSDGCESQFAEWLEAEMEWR